MHWDETSHPLYMFQETQAQKSRVWGSCIHLPSMCLLCSRYWRFKTRVKVGFPSLYKWPQELRLRAWLAGGTRSGRASTVFSRKISEEEEGFIGKSKVRRNLTRSRRIISGSAVVMEKGRELWAPSHVGETFTKLQDGKVEVLARKTANRVPESPHTCQFCLPAQTRLFFSPAHFLLWTNKSCIYSSSYFYKPYLFHFSSLFPSFPPLGHFLNWSSLYLNQCSNILFWGERLHRKGLFF